MTDWAGAAPAVLLAVAAVVLPGLGPVLALRLRGVAAWATAPLVSSAAFTVVPVLCAWWGLRWGAAAAAVTTAVLWAAAGAWWLVRRGIRRRSGSGAGPESGPTGRAQGPGPDDSAPVSVPTGQEPNAPATAATAGNAPTATAPVATSSARPARRGVASVAGLVVAGAVSVAVLAAALGDPRALSQTLDAMFHLNALRWIQQTGDASSLDLRHAVQVTGSGFYPATWHAWAGLLVPGPHSSVTLAANATSFAVAAVIWPAGALLLCREVLGRRVLVDVLAPVVSVCFVAFPWLLFSWGVLWPNALSIALLPALLAVTVRLLGLGASDADAQHPEHVGTTQGGPGGAGVPGVSGISSGSGAPIPTRGALLAVGAAGFVGACGAHPSAAFTLVLVAVPLTWCRWARSRSGTEALRAAWLAVASSAALLFLVVLVVATPVFAGQRAIGWPARHGLATAALMAVGSSPETLLVAPATAAAVLVGVVVAWRSTRLRWLPVVWVVASVAYVWLAALGSAGLNPIKALSGLWYNDRYRIAAQLPLVAVPLAVLGVVAVVDAVRRRVGDGAPRRSPARRTVPVVAVAVVLVAGLLPGAVAARQVTALGYLPAAGPDHVLADATDVAFLERAGRMLPADAVVANSPWDGSALLYAYTGRSTLYRAFNARADRSARVLADRAEQLGTNPTRDRTLCAAVRRAHVGYVIWLGGLFHPRETSPKPSPGLDRLADSPGLTQVLAGPRGAGLYRITACSTTH